MNTTALNDYQEALALVGDPVAAAHLALASAIRDSGRVNAPEKAAPEPSMIGFNEAARILGMAPGGLRVLVDRSRKAAAGKLVAGPTIRFHQSMPHAPVMFRREWLDAYIDGNSHEASTRQQPRKKSPWSW